MGSDLQLRSVALCALALATIAIPLATLTACGPKPKLSPRAGVYAHESSHFVSLPKGVSVNVVGGNVVVRRTDLSLDTRLGTWVIDATYNSTTGEWRHDFEMSYDGATFVDDTGASMDVGSDANTRVPGTKWVRVDATKMKTLGGLLYEFGTDGLLEAIYWTDQTYPRLEFVVSGGNVTQIDQCTSASACGMLFTMTYGSDGITALDDHAGRQALFTYTNGKLATARDGLDVAQGWAGFRYGYDGNDLTSVLSSENEEVRIAYDGKSRGSGVTLIGEGDPEYTFAYHPKNGAGRFRTVVTNPESHATRYFYDSQRRLAEVEAPTGESTLYTWATSPTIFHRESMTDGAGVTTSWTYTGEDASHRHDSWGNSVTTTFSPYASNHLNRASAESRPALWSADPVGQLFLNSYDSTGRLEWTENGEGERTTFSHYDSGTSVGAVAWVTPPAGPATLFSHYGAHGHATRVTFSGLESVLAFDPVGNQLAGKNFLGPNDPGRPGVVSRSFDEDRNLVSVGAENFNLVGQPITELAITITYRSDGQMTFVDRPYGGHHGFTYDALGRLRYQTEFVDSGLEVATTTYHADGAVASKELANGMRTEIDYDASNRPTAARKIYGAKTRDVSYAYQDGRLVSQTDSAYGSPEQFEYDDHGRLVVHTFPSGETITSEYDARSRENRRVYDMVTAGQIAELTATYDDANRRLALTHDGELKHTQTVVDGRLAAETFGNDLTRSYVYDDALSGRVSNSTTSTSGGAVLETTAITRGQNWPALWQVSSDSTVWVGASQSTSSEHYTMSSNVSGTSGLVLAWDAGGFYQFDQLGNLSHDHSQGYAYNAERNRLSSYAGTTFAYDKGFVVDRDGVPITWTATGRIATHGSDTFEWDSDGRPIEFSIDGVDTQYRFGGQVELTSAGALVALDLGNVRVALSSLADDLYRHRDFRGNVKFVSDETGTIVVEREYNGYQVTKTVGGGDDRSFAGGKEIGDGLIILGARVYDSSTRRFLSPDPVFNLRSQYTYTGGNPVWLWDPDGRQSFGASLDASAMSAGQSFETAGEGVVAVGGVIAGTGALLGPAGTGAVAFGGTGVVVGGLSIAYGKALKWAGENGVFTTIEGWVLDLGDSGGTNRTGDCGTCSDGGNGDGLPDINGDQKFRQRNDGRPPRPRPRPPKPPKPPAPGGGGGGGGGGNAGVGGGAGGCASPTSIVASAPIVSRPTLLGLVSLQVVLGLVTLVRRRREE